MPQARFWHWWTSTGLVAAIGAFSQWRYDILGQIGKADNAIFIYAVALMGVVVSLRIGRISYLVAVRGDDMPSLARVRYLAFSAPVLGMIGTVLGVKDVLLKGLVAPAGGNAVQAVLSAFAGGLGTTLWSTAAGLCVLFFLGYQITDLTGEESHG